MPKFLPNSLFFIVLTIFSQNSFADNIDCKMIMGIQGDDASYSLVMDKLSFDCDEYDESKGRVIENAYRVEIEGAGLSIGAAFAGGILVECPFQEEIEGTYYGVKVQAAALVGGKLGLFASNDGACMVAAVTGVSAEVGITINSMKISKK